MKTKAKPKEYSCLKQVVKAYIIPHKMMMEEKFHYSLLKNVGYGENSMKVNVKECPRLGMKSGEGYELCRDVCKQSGHAEIRAIEDAKRKGINTQGAHIILKGHTYFCDPCKKALMEIGVTHYKIEVEGSFIDG